MKISIDAVRIFIIFANCKGDILMYLRFLFIITLVVAAMTLAAPVSAQPKAVGGTLSYSGFSITYEHTLTDGRSFVEAAVKAETGEMSAGRSQLPGLTLSATWNTVLKEWDTSEDNQLTLFAGPGVTLGYVPDWKSPMGTVVGLRGKLGVECSFKRNIIISASINPVVGCHAVYTPRNITLKFYKNGVIYDMIPEIGVKYRF